MSAIWWRHIARKAVRHASWVLPDSRSIWAEAMRRELDYIENDRAALRWAAGCIIASYAARLAALRQAGWRTALRPVLAGAMLVFTALALAHASARPEPSGAVLESPGGLSGIPPDVAGTRPGSGPD
jgi:hypothetical protein